MKAFPLDPYRGLPDEQQVKKWTSFATSIKKTNKEKITAMAGFVSLNMAVKSDADKKQVLEQMEKQDLDWLPVVWSEDGVSEF